ncbi:MAG: hypothetical protein LM522_06680 [Candidatus Contendobacter sp.]|nr:hypothetical protein [Candidatus Contendobacter sp.]
MKNILTTPALDRQINDYLLTASGHLKETRPGLDLQRIAAYGAAAGSALVMISQAEAAVVVTTGAPVTVVAPANGTNYESFDMNGDLNNDFALFGAITSEGTSAGINGTQPGGDNSVLGNGNVYKVASGVNIESTPPAGQNWQDATDTNRDVFFSAGDGTSNWDGNNSEYGFAGVRFLIGQQTHYGWIRLHVNDPGSLTAVCWAYESTPDTAIAAGAGFNPDTCNINNPPPPPSSARSIPVMGLPALGLMALAMGGAVGLGNLRRRRQNPRKPPQP